RLFAGQFSLGPVWDYKFDYHLFRKILPFDRCCLEL
ncbi:unnamed protein product, partial [marine sediment metagenome]